MSVKVYKSGNIILVEEAGKDVVPLNPQATEFYVSGDTLGFQNSTKGYNKFLGHWNQIIKDTDLACTSLQDAIDYLALFFKASSAGGASEWGEITGTLDDQTDLSTKLAPVSRIETDAVFWLKGDGTSVGDIKAEVSSGSIKYVELKSQTPDVWETATLVDINLSTHGSLNARLEALENAREFAGALNPNDGYGVLTDAVSGQYWIVDTAGTLDGIVMGINDMVICHTDVTGVPTGLSSFAHLASTINAMVGCDGSTDGVTGSVPKPIAGQQNYVLNGAGVWVKTVELETVKVDNLITENIKITENPVVGKVLITDTEGKGTWGYVEKIVSPNNAQEIIVTDSSIVVTGDLIVNDETEFKEDVFIDGDLEVAGKTPTKAYWCSQLNSKTYLDGTSGTLIINAANAHDSSNAISISSSIITLKGGRAYRVEINPGGAITGVTDYIRFGLTLSTGTDYIMSAANLLRSSTTYTNAGNTIASAIVAPSVDTAYRIYYTAVGNINIIDNRSSFIITEL